MLSFALRGFYYGGSTIDNNLLVAIINAIDRMGLIVKRFLSIGDGAPPTLRDRGLDFEGIKKIHSS